MQKPRLLALAVALVAALTLGVYGAFATEGAHFMPGTSSSVNDDGALVVNWDEAGLGNANITYTLTADATALFACINNGGKHPKAENKQSFEGQVAGGGSFQARNGRVQASLTAGPLEAPQFTCPSGQDRVLAEVTYTNIVLTDTTNGVVEPVPDAHRCFFPNIRNLCVSP
jgi:hypothetical protein